MNKVQIRPAIEENFTVVWEITQQCVQDLLNMGLDQWGDFYPTQDVIRKDIQTGQMHTLWENGNCIGMVTLNEKQESQYDDVEWTYNEPPFLIIHRLMTRPSQKRKGYASRLMNFTETIARENGYHSIRLDAYSKNPAAIELYQKLGYEKSGQVWFEHRKYPFDCFEKKI